MSTTLSPKTGNSYVAALSKIFDEATTPIRWLVISHNDPQMIRSLSASMANEAVAFLHLSQDTWNFDDDEFIDAIHWALEQDSITNIVLAGSSQAAGSDISVSMTQPDLRQAENGYAKLLAGVKLQNTRNREASRMFGSQAKQFLQIPVVHNARTKEQLQVHGLFYRVESGLFLAFDFEASEFRPLVSR